MKRKFKNIRIDNIIVTLSNGGAIEYDNLRQLELFKIELEKYVRSHLNNQANVSINYKILSKDVGYSTGDIVELPNGKRFPVNALCLDDNEILLGNKKYNVSKLKKVCTKQEIWEYYLSSGKTVVDIAEHFKLTKFVLNNILNEFLTKY